MKLHRTLLVSLVVTVALFACQLAVAQRTDPLPSWNDGAAKTAILAFVAKTTREGSPDFVPVPERIATFDNDGTLLAEKPLYFQIFFVLDRVRTMAPQHPEWQTKEPFASVLRGDLEGVLAGGDEALLELALATRRACPRRTSSRANCSTSSCRSF